jgi:hypothetical protein
MKDSLQRPCQPYCTKRTLPKDFILRTGHSVRGCRRKAPKNNCIVCVTVAVTKLTVVVQVIHDTRNIRRASALQLTLVPLSQVSIELLLTRRFFSHPPQICYGHYFFNPHRHRRQGSPTWSAGLNFVQADPQRPEDRRCEMRGDQHLR